MFKIGQDVNAGLSNFGINLNLTFTERVDLNNLESQLDQRKWIADYCFNSLNVSSISFVKQSSLHLFSEGVYNGVVVDFGAEATQICPVENGYTS